MSGETKRVPERVGSVDRLFVWLARHWLLVFNLGMSVFVGGTLLAPALMHLGLDGPARTVYAFYGLNCHQLPERSYFLFGPNGIDTYSRAQVLAWGADPGYLRGFVGNTQLGFKLAMAERNTAIYATLLVAGLAYALARRRLRPLPGRAFTLLILPMAVDGFSHVLAFVLPLLIILAAVGNRRIMHHIRLVEQSSRRWVRLASGLAMVGTGAAILLWFV